MHRRSFIRKCGISGAALTLFPAIPMAHAQEEEYTVGELMGKEAIPLYGKGIQLRKEAARAYEAMKNAAHEDGIAVKLISGYRSFAQQEAIFERKYLDFTEELRMTPLEAVDRIIEYSTIPGTSRHHWGTDVDIVDGNQPASGDVLVPDKFRAGGPYEDIKAWMDEHAKNFDYHLVYTDDPGRKGFKYEPWHYSYAPLSIPMLDAFRSKNIMLLLGKEEFLGCEHFTAGFVKSYIRDNILDINPVLL